MTSITGTYKLNKYGYQSKKDDSFKPISEFYSGSIHYAENGYMNVIVRFAETPKEIDDVVAYCGQYKIQGNKIVHTVQSSVRPSYEGQVLNRDFKIDGDLLITEFENTAEFIKFAVWKRI